MALKSSIWRGTRFPDATRQTCDGRSRPLSAGNRTKQICAALPFDGIEPATQAMLVAERVNNDLLLAKCLKMLVEIYMETGNFPAAMTVLTRALPLGAQGRPMQSKKSGIFNNLGLAHQYAGQFSMANSLLMSGQLRLLILLRLLCLTQAYPLVNVAVASFHLRDFSRGLSAAERAIELLAAPSDDGSAWLAQRSSSPIRDSC